MSERWVIRRTNGKYYCGGLLLWSKRQQDACKYENFDRISLDPGERYVRLVPKRKPTVHRGREVEIFVQVPGTSTNEQITAVREAVAELKLAIERIMRGEPAAPPCGCAERFAKMAEEFAESDGDTCWANKKTLLWFADLIRAEGRKP